MMIAPDDQHLELLSYSTTFCWTRDGQATGQLIKYDRYFNSGKVDGTHFNFLIDRKLLSSSGRS